MRLRFLSWCVVLLGCGAGGPGTTFPPDDGTPVKPVLSAGRKHSCRVNADQTVSCWGFSMYGALGSGLLESNLSAPTVVPGLTGVEEVAVGSNHTCARLGDGTVRCWGMATNGRIGHGVSAEYVDVPTPVLNLSGAVQLAAGEGNSCAVLGDGSVKCWGLNDVSQCALASPRELLTATAVPLLSGAVQVALGKERFGCARLGDGKVKCWGLDSVSGRLGRGEGDLRTSLPSEVAGVSNLTHLGAGLELVCGRQADGKVLCWGQGFGATPTEVSAASPAVEVSVGLGDLCVRKANREVWCGAGGGALKQVEGLAGAAQVAVGEGFTCAQLLDGTTWCWGDNHYGQVGDGTKVASRATPVQAK